MASLLDAVPLPIQQIFIRLYVGLAVQNPDITAKESCDFWLAAGAPFHLMWSNLGNEQRETGFNWTAIGDHGNAHGIGQWWWEPRGREILEGCGIDVRTAGHPDQLRAMFWELKKTGLWDKLMATSTVEEACDILVRKWERPAEPERDVALQVGFANALKAKHPEWERAPISHPATPSADLVAATAAAGLAAGAASAGAGARAKLPLLKWVASPNYYAEPAIKPDLIVLHDCEGSYAGAVSWFSQARSKVSAHLVLKEDGTEATQMVPFDRGAWHAMAFNKRSIGVEIGGYSNRGFPEAELRNLALVTAYLLHKLGIPCQFARGGRGPGFCRHFDLGEAGGGHRDFTTNDAAWAAFIQRVQQAYAAGFVGEWKVGAPPPVLARPLPPAPPALASRPSAPIAPKPSAVAQAKVASSASATANTATIAMAGTGAAVAGTLAATGHPQAAVGGSVATIFVNGLLALYALWKQRQASGHLS